jgi:uncharacterized YccA/Bax inhibitor family protein
MNYHRVCSKSNTMGATCGAGTAYPSGVLKVIPDFSCFSIFSFILSVLLINVCSFTFSHFIDCPSNYGF